MHQYNNTMTLHGVAPVAGGRFVAGRRSVGGALSGFQYPNNYPSGWSYPPGTPNLAMMGMSVGKRPVYGLPTIAATR